MSDLNEFQNDETWRCRLRNFLLMERPPQRDTRVETERFSLDLCGDLRELLEVKRISSNSSNNQEQQSEATKEIYHGDDNKENKEFNDPLAENLKRKKPDDTLASHNESLAGNRNKSVNMPSDESFEAIESMCDKTASDPNSTLFEYLNCGQKKLQSQVLNVKKDSLGKRAHGISQLDNDPEAAALQRLLNELRMDDQLDNESPLKGVDVTQLDDVEAPSLWENTLMGETMLQTSPVKMVGMLRPSTIMEEGADESLMQSSHTSPLSCASTSHATYVSARKNTGSEISISSYETAQESVISEPISFNAVPLTAEIESSDVDLIDLDGTTASGKFKAEDSDADSDEYVIEVFSDDEQQAASINTTSQQQSECYSGRFSNNTYSCTETSTAAIDTQFDKSRDFNDTLEEIDYILQKGMQEMQSKAEQVPHLAMVSNSELTPTKMVNTPKAPLTAPHSSGSLNIRPIPKLEFFAKPSGIPTSAGMRLKSHTGKNFAHILSPVATYMKRTGTAPLMTNIKSRTKSTDIHNSSAFRSVELETRNLQASSLKKGSAAVGCNSPRSLPKAAYISSEFRHMIDERTPLTIPGGKSIHKYIDSAMMPAVMRHEGKIKLGGGGANGSATKLPTKLQTQVDANTAHGGQRSDMPNLSVMSGDISVYTIRDAQKF